MLLAAHEWEACGEGARNVVLRYSGSQAPLVRMRRGLACSMCHVHVWLIRRSCVPPTGRPRVAVAEASRWPVERVQ